MGYHAAGEGRCENHLSRSVLVCAYCIGFCAASPLPGYTRLEALSEYNLRNSLHGTERIGMSEIHREKCFDKFKGSIGSELNGFEPSNIGRGIING